MQRIFITILFTIIHVASVSAAELTAVQIYSDNVLLDLIKENKHLSQVVIDDCQLVPVSYTHLTLPTNREV